MNDDVTVTLPRAQYDAVVAMLRAAGWDRTGDFEGPALTVLDLRDALKTMEAAARRGSLKLA